MYPTPLRIALAALCLLPCAILAHAQTIKVTVDAAADRKPVSPYLYGKNDFLGLPDSPLADADFQRFRDAGVKMLRLHGGNNSTKYNWQKRLSSHPDWYNNVYASNDWDYAQKTLQSRLPGVQAMWAFQLLGKVADNTNNNFNDWAYNQSQWWSGVGQNLAGGGTLNPTGSKALKEGNPALYLTDTSADISTAILDHWMKPSGLGLDRNQFRYWNMDNEPEIWEGTHDDVMPVQLSAEQFMQRYFEYAKRARARFPEIKLVGPVPANEWQWYNWPNGTTVVDGVKLPWLQFFIKRIGEEQKRTGIRLLDVLDIHHYPSANAPADVVQLHRVFFDRSYDNPDANGVHAVNGGWDTSIKREYILGRCSEWLNTYLGANHGVTFSVSETDPPVKDAPLASIWYASMLGEFMRNGVEVFTPWSWQPGMWEVLHLYSRYNYEFSVRAVSENEAAVSAYATVEDGTGNAVIVLVNRGLSGSTAVNVELANLAVPNGAYTTLQLAGLPASETFVSHSNNALKTGSITLVDHRFSVTLPALSITSVQLKHSNVTPPATVESKLTNLSVRANSGTGEDALIVGFVVRGSGSKELLIRGIGPTLSKFSIAKPLPDPVLSLGRQSGEPLSSNDNWASLESSVTPASSRLGAFGLDLTSLDAALVSSLADGGYTAKVADKSNRTGIALGEVYAGDSSGTARLINVSARTGVAKGDGNLIGGFVVTGGTTRKLLIRAVGPGLKPFIASGLLEDPVLHLYRQDETIPLHMNDDWGSQSYAKEIADIADKNGAFGLSEGSKDAVLLLSLPAGAYTAVVSGKNDTAGVALVEVYEVP